MLFNKLKVASANKALKKSISERKSFKENNNEPIRSFACIVNIDEFNHLEVFHELSKEMGLRTDQYKIIGFSAGDVDHSNFAIPIFTSKDLGWSGKIENGDIKEFLDKHYDLLLNYYTHSPIILSLVCSYTKAKFRVGLNPDNEPENDLTIKVRTKEFNKFKEEFLKYLSILKKI